LPLLVLTGFVQGLLLGNGIVGRLVRRIPPLLVPQAPELRPDGRADVVPREHLTRHLCGLISRSGAGAYKRIWVPHRLELTATCSPRRLPDAEISACRKECRLRGR